MRDPVDKPTIQLQQASLIAGVKAAQRQDSTELVSVPPDDEGSVTERQSSSVTSFVFAHASDPRYIAH